jgi:RHS repeat-associated protein
LDGIEYEGGTLKFISTEYGRIRRENGSWHYDYFLKDHLGNVRVVLEAPASSIQSMQSNTILYMATMEESKIAEEDPYFANLSETRADRPYNYPDANPLNAKLAKVPGKSRGPSTMLKVMAGDTIEISAKAFYNMDRTLSGKGVDIAPVLGSAIVAMSSPASTVLGEATRLAVDLGAEASQSVALVNVPQSVDNNGEVKPQSGINFILYNSRMEVVEENTGVLLVEDKINEIQTLASDNLIMQEAGFLEVYINNEAQTPVYYDNFTVAATTSNVVEINAYYPYGMLLPALSLMATPDKWNGYKYSGKELQKEMGLNWGDHGARMADYTVGRWWVPDPLSEEYYSFSPYAFAGNNPIRFIDPNGMNYDDYYNEFGKYLYTDNKMTDNIKIIKQKDWDKIQASNTEAISDRTHSNASLDQALDSKSISMENSRLSAKAYSNIFTDVLSKMPDVDVDKLFKGEVSVYTTKNGRTTSDQYNQPQLQSNVVALEGTWYGKIRVTAVVDFRKVGEGGTLTYYSTVSNVRNLLGAHEFIGHGIKGWRDENKAHYKVYEYQMKHGSWMGTTPAFKNHIQKNYQNYLYPTKR